MKLLLILNETIPWLHGSILAPIKVGGSFHGIRWKFHGGRQKLTWKYTQEPNSVEVSADRVLFYFLHIITKNGNRASAVQPTSWSIDANTAASMYYALSGTSAHCCCTSSSVINEEYVRLCRLKTVNRLSAFYSGLNRFSVNRFKPAKKTPFFPSKNRLLAHACWVSNNRFKPVFILKGAHLQSSHSEKHILDYSADCSRHDIQFFVAEGCCDIPGIVHIPSSYNLFRRKILILGGVDFSP